jgi:hypothetical protein
MMHLLEEQVPQPPDDHERELLSSYGLVTEMQFPVEPWGVSLMTREYPRAAAFSTIVG